MFARPTLCSWLCLLTPCSLSCRRPMGLNSYMAGKTGEAFLTTIAEFFVSSGMHANGYEFVNTDEGWEEHTRRNDTGELHWDAKACKSTSTRLATTRDPQGY